MSIHWRGRLVLLFFSLLSCSSLQATHIIGGEIGYTNVSGYTYQVTLSIYGDCAGSSFPTLPNAIPHIEIYKNSASWSYMDLTLTGPGVEVTPVCVSEASNTTCVSTTGTIPGVMKFVYSGTVTLDGPSSNWTFFFNSQFGGSLGAGRSNAITNIVQGSKMALQATLNNVGGPNSSALFTTIPTPFFCINLPQEYNQGGVDPDGDQLSFSLVPGLTADNTGVLQGPVSYIAPYTYSDPLATVPGSFNFNATNGQMSFTPNLVQTSLVVNQITETRGGVVVGTCMREMNLVVLSNCNNQPPFASIPTSTYGSFGADRTITLCNLITNPQFVLQVTDPDAGQHVNVTVTGLPGSATTSIAGNNTSNPVVTINWTIPQPTVPGVYNFYVNCADDGCPLSSKQTFAYTVIILQPVPAMALSLTQESCQPGHDGSIQWVPASEPLTYSLNAGSFQNLTSFTQLQAGTYTITAKDSNGCKLDTVVTIAHAPVPVLTFTTTPETCTPGQDGSILVNASSVNGAITGFTINGGSPQNGGSFTNLSAGLYTVTALDVAGCAGVQLVTVGSFPHPDLSLSTVRNIICYGAGDGWVKARVLPDTLHCTFSLLPGNIIHADGVYTGLLKGSYQLIATSDKGCRDTLDFTIHEPDPFVITQLDIQDATCDKDNASISVQTNYLPPLIYTLRPATYITTDGVFKNVAPGVYTITVRDSNFCTVDTTIAVQAQPNLFHCSISSQDLSCYGWGNEGSAEVTAFNGVEPYTYLWTTNPPADSKRIENLVYGWYFVEVTDASGCVTKDTVYIHPGDCCEALYLPNAFTPNGDGHNDVWKIVTSAAIEIESFKVVNRWGEVIWHTRDPYEAWDGRQNGHDVDEGTYFYLLQYKCQTDGKHYSRKGDITVLK